MTQLSQRTNRWARWLHLYSGVPVVMAMVFYAITGFTLNHPNFNLGESQKTSFEIELPASVKHADWENQPNLSSLQLLHWLDTEHNLRGVELEIEWDDGDQLLIIEMTNPSGAKTVEAYIEDGIAEVFRRELSLVSTLNNLHRSKHVTGLWKNLSDLAAICMLVFCLSGIYLIFINKTQRTTSASWLVLGGGLFLLAFFLMH